MQRHAVGTHHVAGGILDLDDVRAEDAENLHRQRTEHDRGQIDDAITRERTLGIDAAVRHWILKVMIWNGRKSMPHEVSRSTAGGASRSSSVLLRCTDLTAIPKLRRAFVAL